MNRLIPGIARRLFYSDALLLLVVMGGWRFLTDTPLTARTAIAIAGFYVVLTLLRVLRTSPVASRLAAREEARSFVGDPRQVLEIAELTGYEGLRRSTPYLGKWMTISGTCDGWLNTLGQDSIHLSILLDDSHRVNLRFAAEHEPEIRRLQPGQHITANCQIRHSNFTFALENCELVRAGPMGSKGTLRAIAS